MATTDNLENTSNSEKLYTSRSTEVQDIIGSMPPWIVRWGISVIIAFVFLILVMAHNIKYPDLVSSDVTIINSNPVAVIKSHQDTKIQKILLSDSAIVKKGQLIAILDNNINLSDFNKLDSILQVIYYSKNTDQTIDILNFTHSPQIGELLPAYQDLLIVVKNYKKLRDMNTANAIEFEQQIFDKIKNLQTQIIEWKNRYFITSPIDGLLVFIRPIQEGDYIADTEEIIAVNPLQRKIRVAVGKIRSRDIDKIAIGQTIMIEPEGINSKELGYIKGTITKISKININNSYSVNVSLPIDLNTTRKNTIPYQPIVHGKGEILINDKSILSRLISSIKF